MLDLLEAFLAKNILDCSRISVYHYLIDVLEGKRVPRFSKQAAEQSQLVSNETVVHAESAGKWSQLEVDKGKLIVVANVESFGLVVGQNATPFKTVVSVLFTRFADLRITWLISLKQKNVSRLTWRLVLHDRHT